MCPLNYLCKLCKLRYKEGNSQNLTHDSPNFRNYFFLGNFADNLGPFSNTGFTKCVIQNGCRSNFYMVK